MKYSVLMLSSFSLRGHLCLSVFGHIVRKEAFAKMVIKLHNFSSSAFTFSVVCQQDILPGMLLQPLLLNAVIASITIS